MSSISLPSSGASDPHGQESHDVALAGDILPVTSDPGGALGIIGRVSNADHRHYHNVLTDLPNAHHAQSHGAADHTGDVIPAANQDFGAFYSDMAQIAAPANPPAGTRRVFVDSADGKLKVRTSAGSSVSLEEQGGAGGGPTLARKTATQTINGNVYQDITDLTFAVAANTTYHFVFYLSFRSATTTTGFGFSVNGPTQSLLDYIVHYQTTANAATTGDVTQRKDTAYDAMAATTSTITANADLRVRIEGIVRTTAAGTLAARVRSELANNDLTVQAESVGILTTFA